MTAPDWTQMAGLIGQDTLDAVEGARRADGTFKRRRKLGALGTLYLCLGVAFHSRDGGLESILLLLAASLGAGWRLTAAGFCKARSRFSPQAL